MIAQDWAQAERAEQATREVLVRVTDDTGYVLVVEDDESICEVVSVILADVGYEAVCAQSAERALRLVVPRGAHVVGRTSGCGRRGRQPPR